MQSSDDKPLSIEANIKIALANSGDWIGPSDTGAIAALMRLAKLIDQLFDMGETKDLPALLARLTNLMEQLQITPKARSDQDLLPKEIKKDGADFQEAYLRLVSTASPDDSRQGKKSGTASSGAGRSNRSTSTPLAKKRP